MSDGRKGWIWAQMFSLLHSCTSTWGICCPMTGFAWAVARAQNTFQIPPELCSSQFFLDSHTLPTQHGDFSRLGAGNLALIHYIHAILDVSYALSFEMEKPRFEKI